MSAVHPIRANARNLLSMLRFSVLASGSRGNAILIWTPQTKVLVDNGLSFKQLRLRAEALGESLDDLQGIFVTHEHADHVNGLGTLARRSGAPVFITRETRARLPVKVGDLPRVEHFEAGDALALGDLALHSFSVSHDAADPVCFVVNAGGAQLGVATDLGHAPALVMHRLEGSHALVLESNYCPDMLSRGPYPVALQQRIRGRHGHLSNADSTAVLQRLQHPELQVVVLAHVSRDNNTWELAHRAGRDALAGHAARIHVAQQDAATPVFEVRP